MLQVLATSMDTSLCRKSSALLAIVIRNVINYNAFAEVLQEAGEHLISVVFSRLQTEMIKSTAETLSEILMLLARNYPQETRLFWDCFYPCGFVNTKTTPVFLFAVAGNIPKSVLLGF